jgi:hypothetical protein
MPKISNRQIDVKTASSEEIIKALKEHMDLGWSARSFSGKIGIEFYYKMKRSNEEFRMIAKSDDKPKGNFRFK